MAKPVIIHNNIKIGSDELESKLIKLLDQIIIEVRKNKQDSTQLETAKKDLKDLSSFKSLMVLDHH